MKTFLDRPWMCFICGYAMDQVSYMGDQAAKRPIDGSLSICMNCGAPYVRSGDAWRLMTKKERDELHPKAAADLLALQISQKVAVTRDLSKKQHGRF